MGLRSAIPWCDATWQVIAGCLECSAGCKNCYSRAYAHRFAGAHPYFAGLTLKQADGQVKWTGRVVLRRDRLADPLTWKKPSRIFVADRGDLFHAEVPFAYIAAVHVMMDMCTDHRFVIVTKRPERAAMFYGWASHQLMPVGASEDYLATAGIIGADWPRVWPPPNTIVCATVESQGLLEPRLRALADIAGSPACGLMVEPMLSPIRLPLTIRTMGVDKWTGDVVKWIVVGCETGPSRRSPGLAAFETLVEQARALEIPVFVKQLPINKRVSTRVCEWPGWASSARDTWRGGTTDTVEGICR